MSSSRLSSTDQEKVMKSLTKALSEEGVKKKLNASPTNTNTKHDVPKSNSQGSSINSKRISTPGLKPMMVPRGRPGGQSQEVPLRTAKSNRGSQRITSVPRPEVTRTNQPSTSPRKQPPPPPPRIKSSNPDLSNLLPAIKAKTPPGESQPNSSTPKQVIEPNNNNEQIIFPISMTQSRPSMLLNPENESSDPEEFYRSVRKLTQYPIAASDRGSIRVLQLEGMDGVAWSRFESIFEEAGENEELADLFDLHKYDYAISTRKRIVDKKHQQFLVRYYQFSYQKLILIYKTNYYNRVIY